MTTKTYSEKLQHPKWQKKRLEILERDKFTCLLCKDKDSTLHVHHREYISDHEPWDYPDDNFMTLCKYCHLTIENIKKEYPLVNIDSAQVYKHITSVGSFVAISMDGFLFCSRYDLDLKLINALIISGDTLKRLLPTINHAING